jgi:DnaJ-class molecular chaperone
VVFKHASEQKPGQVPGDVHVTLKQKRHATFERKGDSLHVTLKVTLLESLTGFYKEITHLDGHKVPIDIKPGTVIYPFQTMVFKREGMPVHEVSSQFGDLHVTFEISFPTSLNSDQMEQIKAIL